MSTRFMLIALLLVSGHGLAEEPVRGEPLASTATAAAAQRSSANERATKPPNSASAKTLSGMSILGNQEAPKSLVIVPWKSSQIGDSTGLSRNLDDSRAPVDRDVFIRELAYYEIRTQ